MLKETKKVIQSNKSVLWALITSGIFLLIFLLYFLNLGSYPLLDTDETRYADMARGMLNSRDFIALYLDSKIFWDKPPLYFWLLDISFVLFDKINEFTVRIPTVLCAIFSVFTLFFTANKACSRQVAFISSLILATSTEFIVFAQVSILDMVLTANIIIAVFSGFLTYFVEEKNKKYFWWIFYTFCAFGLLAKGIPAVVVPFGTMFFTGLYKRNLKEFFKPQYFIVGCPLFGMA